MTTWRYTEPLHDALVEAITEEGWDADYKSEILGVLHSIPEDALISDDHGLYDAEGNLTPWDEVPEEEPVDDHLPHPVTLAEYFGVQHLAELTPEDVEAYRERHYGGTS